MIFVFLLSVLALSIRVPTGFLYTLASTFVLGLPVNYAIHKRVSCMISWIEKQKVLGLFWGTFVMYRRFLW